jgi:hypothetical protein
MHLGGRLTYDKGSVLVVFGSSMGILLKFECEILRLERLFVAIEKEQEERRAYVVSSRRGAWC